MAFTRSMLVWAIVITVLLTVIVSAIYAVKTTAHPSLKSFTYKRTIQGPMRVEVHFPQDWHEGDKRPAILFFFGGGWISGGIEHFLWHANYFARRGLIAIRVDYRVDSRHGTTPDSAVEDGKDALLWLHQNAASLGIDGNKIAVAGTSAGGHIAASTAIYTQKEMNSKLIIPRILILHDPVLDLTEASSELEFSPRELELIREIGKDKARDLSPNKHITAKTPASLVIIGSDDPLVLQGTEFVETMLAAGASATMLLAPGQRHGFANKEPWRSAAIREVEKFLVQQNFLPPDAINTEPISPMQLPFTTYQPRSPTTRPEVSTREQ